MKKSAIVNLIGSLLLVVVAALAIVLTLVFQGILGLTSPTLIISSASAIGTYNGEALTDDTWQLVEGELKDGHRLSVTVSGSQTNVGISENYVTATVYDEHGVDVSGDYTIEYRPGSLNVKARSISIVADSSYKIYDGTPLYADGYTVESALSLLPTDTLEVTVVGSITEIGEAKNTIKQVTIRDRHGEDVTRNYSISTVDGKLIVHDVDTLIFESDSDVKGYDGEALTNTNWFLSAGKLTGGHTARVIVYGTQTEVGSSENSFSVTIVDESGNNVSSQYKIVLMPGTLTVMKQNVTIRSADAQKVYDGTPLTNAAYTVSPALDQTGAMAFQVLVTGTQTDVGSSKNRVENCLITDAAGNNITDNFNIQYDPGTLRVVASEQALRTDLVYRTFDGEKVYDGEPLTNINWALVSGELSPEHIAQVSVTGTRTDVGMSENTLTVRIVDYEGNDVTDRYNIKKETGTLRVLPLEVSITSESAEKHYDGYPLTCARFVVDPAYLTQEYYFDVTMTGAQMSVGSSANTIASCKVYSKFGQDISKNFKVKKTEGTLTVLPPEEDMKRELTYQSASDEKIYDGTPLRNSTCVRTAGELFPGHREVIQMLSSITTVGKVENKILVTIYDSENNIVNNYYKISYEIGTLEVLPRPLTIVSNTDSKEYDGEVLENHGYITQPSDAVLPEHTLYVDIVGRVLYPAKVENTIASWLVVDTASGEDMSFCYEVTRINGTLEVYETSSPQEPQTSMNIGSPEDYDLDAMKQILLYLVKANVDGSLYLKEGSYGDYTGNGFLAAPTYEDLLWDQLSAYYLTALALESAGMEQSTVTIAPQREGPYVEPYYTAKTAQYLQTTDRVIVGDASAAYELPFYAWSDKQGITLPSGLQGYENAYASFVYDTYLTIDDETLTFMQQIIDAESFDKNDPGVIAAVASYIQQAARYDLHYDRALDAEENVAVAFLSEYQAGICQHYAAAGTMLYRALGIPARYTVGYVADAKAGEEVEVTAAQAHAWVEVYIDDLGWVYVEVTAGGVLGGNDGGGDGGDEPGEGSFDLSGSISGSGDAGQDTLYFTLTGGNGQPVYLKMMSYGNFNTETNSWEEAPVYGPLLDGYRSAYFLPALAFGENDLTGSSLAIQPVEGMFGIPYYTDSCSFDLSCISDVSMSWDSLDPYRVTYYSSELTALQRYTYVDYEAEYEQYVRETYLTIDEETRAFMQQIIEENGFSAEDDMIISLVSRYIRSIAGYTLVYDEALDAESNSIVSFLRDYRKGDSRHFASAATMLFRALGIPARYTVGFAHPSVENTTELTGKYAHAWVEVYVSGMGWMYVDVTGYGCAANGTDRPIKFVISPVDTFKEYDGEAITALQSVTGFSSDLASYGFTYDVVVEGDRSELGKGESRITQFRIYDPIGTLVYDKETGLGADKFLITYKTGTVHLFLSQLYFTSESPSKTYDGTPLTLTAEHCTLVRGELGDGYEYVIKPSASASVTYVGKSVAAEFTVTIYKDGVDCTSHYRINMAFGKLTIEPRTMTVKAKDATKNWDGTPLEANEIEYDASELVPGDSVAEFTVIGSQTYPGKASNVIHSIKIVDSNGADVTSNYNILTKDGVLWVTLGF